MLGPVEFYDGVGRVILDANHVDANVGGDDCECKWSGISNMLLIYLQNTSLRVSHFSACSTAVDANVHFGRRHHLPLSCGTFRQKRRAGFAHHHITRTYTMPREAFVFVFTWFFLPVIQAGAERV